MYIATATAVQSGVAWSSYAKPCTATFSRHETFHPRYGWLKKGVDLIERNPSAFADADVHMELGVGKNMAHAIRYWCEAFGLIQTTQSAKGSHPSLLKSGAKSSALALPLPKGSTAKPGGSSVRYSLTHTARELIAGAQALDPYLESTATLWWLHYHLIKTQKATTWSFAINHFGRSTFTARQLLEDLRRFVELEYPELKVAQSSLTKDVQLFLRMYSHDEKAPFHEDSIDSPFVELGLIQKRGETYSFVVGTKPTLPDAIIAAACLDFAATRSAVSAAQAAKGAKSISFNELLHADSSPVKAFRLTEHDLYEALERVISAASTPVHERGSSAAQRVRHHLFISDTAGLKQLSWKADPQQLAHRLLQGYYRHALH